MKPAWKITVNDQPANVDISRRLLQLTLRDLRGFEVDQLDIELDDYDNALVLPKAGAVIGLQIGWHGAALVDKGQYTVTEISHEGPPDKVVIRARSADIAGGFMTKRTRSWHQVTLGDVIKTIATKHSLKPAISSALADVSLPHEDQTDESDAHFLTRLARDFDAIATVKNGHLLFVRAGESTSARGKPLQKITITRRDGDSHTYQTLEQTNKFTGVKTRWLNIGTAQVVDVLVGKEGNVKTLRKTYKTDADATAAADAEWRRLQRNGASFDMTLAEGNPSLIPESPVALVGWKKQITDKAWLAVEVSHKISPSGFTSSVGMELHALKSFK